MARARELELELEHVHVHATRNSPTPSLAAVAVSQLVDSPGGSSWLDHILSLSNINTFASADICGYLPRPLPSAGPCYACAGCRLPLPSASAVTCRRACPLLISQSQGTSRSLSQSLPSHTWTCPCPCPCRELSVK